VIKSDDPVNLRAREVELLGDDRDCRGWNVAERRLHVVQYFDERTRSVTVLRDDTSDGRSLIGR
jgi:hypothetical protein